VNASEYLAGHLEEALAKTGETDVHVAVVGERVVVTGTVATELRRDVVDLIAREVVGHLEVHNGLTVLHCAEPDSVEELP
jgi:Flp pilus assembly secretin CpaC